MNKIKKRQVEVIKPMPDGKDILSKMFENFGVKITYIDCKFIEAKDKKKLKR